ncbi:hypothetical protein ARSEF1564_007559 [Beauveria bassiana]
MLTVIHALRNNGDASARRMILLCGKWAPSDDRFHDHRTVSALQQAFGRRVKDDGQTYDEINYRKVLSITMNLRKRAFIANDADSFTSYLVDAGLGTVGIPGATMLSAIIIRQVGGVILEKLFEVERSNHKMRVNKRQQRRKDCMVVQVNS